MFNWLIGLIVMVRVLPENGRAPNPKASRYNSEEKGVCFMSRPSWLKKETETWVDKGIISRDQAGQILGLYPEDHKNRLISVLLILGAILLGAGVILFFASNWQYLPKWIKVSLVIVPLVLFHLSSQFTHGSYPRLSATLSLLGCIMFGSGIWLIAQIFHINSHFPNGILFWFLGVLPVAFFLREPLPLALSALLLGAWVAAEHSSSPVTILLALLFFAAVFYLTYSQRSPFALAVGLLSAVLFVAIEMVLFLEKSSGSSDSPFLVFLVLLLTGRTIVFLARHPVNKIKYFSLIYAVTGIVLTGVSLYAMSFEFFASGLTEMHQKGLNVGPLWALYLLSAAVCAYLIARDGGPGAGLRKNLFWVLLDLAVLIMLLVPVDKTALMIALNLLLFVWALWVIVTGYQAQNSVHFTLGILAFLIFTITEYFNFFWKTMPKSLFFIVGGLVLIVGGSLLERQRRRVISSWEGVAGLEEKS